MTDTEAPAETPAAPAAPAAKTKKSKSPSKKVSQSNHPKYREMVKTAITCLKDRTGSSRQAIIKYILANYSVCDNQKMVASSVKMALKAGVAAQVFKQTKGVGASGSFKLGTGSKPEKAKTKASKAKKAAKPRSPKKPASKPKKKKAATKKSPKPKKSAPKKSVKSKKPAPKKASKVKKPATKKTVKPKKAKK